MGWAGERREVQLVNNFVHRKEIRSGNASHRTWMVLPLPGQERAVTPEALAPCSPLLGLSLPLSYCNAWSSSFTLDPAHFCFSSRYVYQLAPSGPKTLRSERK